MNDNLKLSGKLSITHLDCNGNVLNQINKSNLIVTAGKEWVAALIETGSGTAMTHMGIGTSATAPTITDTTLGTQAARVAFDSDARVDASITYVATFGAGVGTGSIVEAGLFNASSGGTMLSRTTFTAVDKAAADTLEISWTVSVG